MNQPEEEGDMTTPEISEEELRIGFSNHRASLKTSID
jgi:hypothetical protein